MIFQFVLIAGGQTDLCYWTIKEKARSPNLVCSLGVT